MKRSASLIGAVVLLALAIVCAPGLAGAKSYTMPRVAITAGLNGDGSMDVTEQRTFDFDGDFSYVYWDLPFSDFELRGLSTKTAGEPQSLTPNSSEDSGTYEVEKDGEVTRITAYFDASDEQVTYELRYRVAGAVKVYADTAELYWQFIGDEWSEPVGAVTINIWPAEALVELAKTDVRAWAHGPLWGTVEIGDDGGVQLAVSDLDAYTFVEARVLYPVQLFPDAHMIVGPYRQTVLKEEARWAAEANEQRAEVRATAVAARKTALWVNIAGSGAALVLVAITLVLFFKYGKEYRTKLPFVDKYWREDPRPDLPPALVGALWRMGSVKSEDIVATMMNLTDTGAIAMSEEVFETRGLFKKKESKDYVFTLLKATSTLDAIDKELADFLFSCGQTYTPQHGAAAGLSGAGFTFDDLKDYAKTHQERYAEQVNNWKTTVKAQAQARGLIDSVSASIQVISGVLAALTVLLAVGAGFVGAFVAVGVAAVCAVANVLLTANMSRRTPEGDELYRYYKGLYHYLKDFSKLDEAPPASVLIWKRYLVLATVFGIADEVAKQLKVVMPEMLQDPAFGPTYYWMYGGLHHTAPVHLFNDTLSAAHAAAIAGSIDSSGGGFGGGFSGGGGFGGGGGGGGAG
jgi:uncharacterized membrane protein